MRWCKRKETPVDGCQECVRDLKPLADEVDGLRT